MMQPSSPNAKLQTSSLSVKIAALTVVLISVTTFILFQSPSNLPPLLRAHHINETALVESLNRTLTATIDARLSQLLDETRNATESRKTTLRNVVNETISNLLTRRPNCTYPWPVVYNKPHKTASTKIQKDIWRWTRQTGRSFFSCAGAIQKAVYTVRECVKEELSGCAVVATHMQLDGTLREALERKIGEFRTVTSTRNGRDRILSMYLQYRHIDGRKGVNETDVKVFLKGFNPWELYNYHTGEGREGKCPLTFAEKREILAVANRYDVVVSAEFWRESNVVLRDRGLFELSGESWNVRGAGVVKLSDDVEKLIAEVSCVDDELHRHFKFRLAAMYERAKGGKTCIIESRTPTTCLDARYRH